MEADLFALTPLTSGDAPRFSGAVREGWRQGRGAFGGLILGLLTRALETCAGPDRPLRSLTGALCGPTLAGPVEILVELLRAGSGMTTAAARLVQGGEVQAHAVGVLGRARDGAFDGARIAPPRPPPWRDVEPLPAAPANAAEFAQFFELRNTGPRAFGGGSEAVAEGWVRPRGQRAIGTPWLVACADAWWPALFALERAPRPMATVAFTFEPMADRAAGADLDAPLFHRARMIAARDGHVVEERELWSEDGRLLALNHQTFVVIR